MGIPMWREPSEADTFKSALDKDPSAAARSAIRRQATILRPSQHQNSRSRRSGVLSSFHSQILDEIQRGIAEPQLSIRSPVLNLGISEDGLDLDSSRREALSRSGTRPSIRSRNRFTHLRNIRDQTANDSLGQADPQTRPGTAHLSPSLTPNFAPAISYHTSSSPHLSSEGIRLPPLPRLRSTERNLEPSSDTTASLLRDYRIARALHQSSRDPATDGLGDRQRSLSPDVERPTDAWETLLSTITPDVNLPSTDTSFSANSASDVSRNESSRNPRSSSQTLPSSLGLPRAVHLALDPYPDHLPPCDFSSSDDEDVPVTYHRMLSQAGLPLALRRSPGLNSTMSSHPPIPTISFSFSDASSDSDLQQMQAILDRLARRDDIPDHWWAGAGLSRTIGRGLSASADANENERTE
ncbi:hypothetical protein N7462_009409 [Penicillium macrosclerotiorum]|uniref:uncharacterized protein n=1 Tax=Penicillium macrosclerotiorum TaxID=303699 RepID=UPI002547EFC3|nr:uncharacterized protein N7462_009409 [Penicillium macrosclerotiorum]KAJ5673970.1 hypothetical protein N7462_009409 [Penicillium macrosclerotiorum]